MSNNTALISIDSKLPNNRYIVSSGENKYTIDLNKHICTCAYSVKTSTKQVFTTCKHIKYVIENKNLVKAL